MYPLPYDFQVSGTYKNLPGFPDTANLVLSNAQVAPQLGRSLSACPAVGNCTATFTAAIVPFGSNPGTTTTGTLFDTRLNQVDVRLTKAFRLNRTRLMANLDLYNLFNDRPPQGINATYGTAWLRPTLLLGGRLLKFGGQIDF